jgi:hypothetical protein
MQGTRFECAFTGKKLGVSPVSRFFQNFTKDVPGYALNYLFDNYY